MGKNSVSSSTRSKFSNRQQPAIDNNERPPLSSDDSNSVTLNETLKPHLKTTLFFTFSYVVAWSWDLVVYGISHAMHGMNPLQDQLSFGDHPGPKNIVVLLLEFLSFCFAAAVLSSGLEHVGEKWTKGANQAVMFFPSAVFGGKLMGYLGQFADMGAVQRALINLGATFFCAFLSSIVPMNLGPPLKGFGRIVRDSLGFGLGIAWNVFTLSIFAPDEMDIAHIVGLGGFLALVLLIAFRVAAEGAYVDTLDREMNVIDRMWGLLSFAMNTASAFTLVAFVDALTHEKWLGDIECFFILLIFSAFMSAGVTRIDMDAAPEQANQGMENCGLDHLPCVLRVLVFIPCFWCCCPWVPLIFILSGVHGIGVKEKWFSLISMVSGLAASIEASGMLTASTNAIAEALNICTEKHCYHPWKFVVVQGCIALLTTIILIPTLVSLVPDFLLSTDDEESAFHGQDPIEYVTQASDDAISLLSPTPPPSVDKRYKYDSV